jgi:hypothetical protein
MKLGQLTASLVLSLLVTSAAAGGRAEAAANENTLAAEWLRLGDGACNRKCSVCLVSTEHRNNEAPDSSATHEGTLHACALNNGSQCGEGVHKSCGGGDPTDSDVAAVLDRIVYAATSGDALVAASLLHLKNIRLNRDRQAIQVLSDCGVVTAHVPVTDLLLVRLDD